MSAGSNDTGPSVPQRVWTKKDLEFKLEGLMDHVPTEASRKPWLASAINCGNVSAARAPGTSPGAMWISPR